MPAFGYFTNNKVELQPAATSCTLQALPVLPQCLGTVLHCPTLDWPALSYDLELARGPAGTAAAAAGTPVCNKYGL